MTEEWRDVLYFRNGKLIKLDGYQVERYSQQVRSFKRREVHILKPRTNKNGYYVFGLVYNKNLKNYTLHKIMIDTFEPDNPLNLPQINHKNIDNLDGRANKLDNRLENLERCTASQNEKHSFEVLGKKPQYGEANGQAKLTEVQVKEIIKLLEEDKLTQRQIAKKYDIKQSHVGYIKSGRLWKHIERPVFAKKTHSQSKLTGEEVIEIYNDAWFSGLKVKQIAKKHSVSEDIVKDTKKGKSWSSVTKHIKGTKPTINKPVTEDQTDLDNWL